jgi:hypothetical protein
LPIILQIEKKDTNPTSPIKFNPIWLEDEECLNLVKEEWVAYDGSSRGLTSFQFVVALKNKGSSGSLVRF